MSTEVKYTNELTTEVLAKLSRAPFTPEQRAGFSEEEMGLLVRPYEDFLRRHPLIAIYRLAVEGSHTRLGGEIRKGSSGFSITLAWGRTVHAARVGDEVEYPDGRRVRIISGSGAVLQDDGHAIALVGSRLSNGDEIVDTPQDGVVLEQREGRPMAEDFLCDAWEA
jgi:uncharacterized Zn-binding protein involved in type VI secretion